MSASAVRDTTGLVIDAEWRWSDVPGPANAPESSVEALDSLRQGTRLRMRIGLASAGRMSIAFLGNGYPWPDGTEIRARADRLGHILVWPDGKRYRNVVTGTLRAMFTDRRLDRGHLFVPKITHQAPGSALGQVTTKQVLSTPVGEIHLEQANFPTAGDGAALLCRFLVELMGIDPETRACSSDTVALRANLASSPGGKLQFVVNQVAKKQELPLAVIQFPPEGASFETGGAPIPASTVPKGQLEALRHRPIAPAVAVKQGPQQGLVAANRTLALRALLIDGVTVAWLPSGGELTLLELKAGNYSVSWRDFFGTFIEPPKLVGVPSEASLGQTSRSWRINGLQPLLAAIGGAADGRKLELRSSRPSIGPSRTSKLLWLMIAFAASNPGASASSFPSFCAITTTMMPSRRGFTRSNLMSFGAGKPGTALSITTARIPLSRIERVAPIADG